MEQKNTMNILGIADKDFKCDLCDPWVKTCMLPCFLGEGDFAETLAQPQKIIKEGQLEKKGKGFPSWVK
jgi:hypothetical protein